MKTLIVLTILAVLPISCQFGLYRKLAANAHQAAQKIIDTETLSQKTRDWQLYLSIFDKSFSCMICGHTWTYADMEANPAKYPDDQNYEVELVVAAAVFDGEVLKFTVVSKHSPEEKYHYTAVRSGEDFKIVTATIEGMRCP